MTTATARDGSPPGKCIGGRFVRSAGRDQTIPASPDPRNCNVRVHGVDGVDFKGVWGAHIEWRSSRAFLDAAMRSEQASPYRYDPKTWQPSTRPEATGWQCESPGGHEYFPNANGGGLGERREEAIGRVYDGKAPEGWLAKTQELVSQTSFGMKGEESLRESRRKRRVRDIDGPDVDVDRYLANRANNFERNDHFVKRRHGKKLPIIKILADTGCGSGAMQELAIAALATHESLVRRGFAVELHLGTMAKSMSGPSFGPFPRDANCLFSCVFKRAHEPLDIQLALAMLTSTSLCGPMRQHRWGGVNYFGDKYDYGSHTGGWDGFFVDDDDMTYQKACRILGYDYTFGYDYGNAVGNYININLPGVTDEILDLVMNK